LGIDNEISPNLKCNPQQALNIPVQKCGVYEDKRW